VTKHFRVKAEEHIHRHERHEEGLHPEHRSDSHKQSPGSDILDAAPTRSAEFAKILNAICWKFQVVPRLFDIKENLYSGRLSASNSEKSVRRLQFFLTNSVFGILLL